MATGTFDVGGAFALDVARDLDHRGCVFLGFLFVLTIKLRKSPFDLSMSHHAHQEIVRGVTTEMSGKTLAQVEVMHWCENILFMGWVGLFFVWGNPLSVVLAIVVVLAVYFLEIWIDNNFARVKWQALLKSALDGRAGGRRGQRAVVLRSCKEGFHDLCNKIAVGHPLRRFELQRLRHRGAGRALPRLYDVERFGIINTGNPKHADIFLVTGSVNEQNIDVVKEIYDQMVEPKVVVACGICACTAGIFHDCYNVIGGVDKAIPVDVYAPGCAVRPEAIIDAVVAGIGILEEKSKALQAKKKGA